ncbi:hypothetical protein [Chitinophaga caseinilytica]|uniref:Uncharacterized protein n=1 Tax=Chitinophaga caseinilytica TaxID=2267521 RepID=A0ABZ2YZF5_9BACT
MSGTSDEEDIWFDYQLIGQKTISIRLAHQANYDVIFYEINYPEELASTIELMDFVTGSFYMKSRHSV